MRGRKSWYQLPESDDEASMSSCTLLGDSSVTRSMLAMQNIDDAGAAMNEKDGKPGPPGPTEKGRPWNSSEFLPDEENMRAEAETTKKTGVVRENGIVPELSDKECFPNIETLSFDEGNCLLRSEQHRSCRRFPGSSTKRRLNVSKGLKHTPRITVPWISLAKKMPNHQHERHQTLIERRENSFDDDENHVPNKEADMRDGPPRMEVSKLKTTPRRPVEMTGFDDIHVVCKPAGLGADVQKESKMTNASPQLVNPQREASNLTHVETQNHLWPSTYSSTSTDGKNDKNSLQSLATSISTASFGEEGAPANKEFGNSHGQDVDQRALKELLPSSEKNGRPELNMDSRVDRSSRVTNKQNEAENISRKDATDGIAGGKPMKQPTKEDSIKNLPHFPRGSQKVATSGDQPDRIPIPKKVVSFSNFEDVRYYVQETFTDVANMSSNKSSLDGSEDYSYFSETFDDERQQELFKENICVWTAIFFMSDLQRCAQDFSPGLAIKCSNCGISPREQENDDAGDTDNNQSAVSGAVQCTEKSTADLEQLGSFHSSKMNETVWLELEAQRKKKGKEE